ncbi:SOS response-associated peptidase [Paenibacillus sp. y28]|uniref:SOS response-associated peptidase n=1 Tax=Paenibacillus sp. y28 TaxID=3129110 RepID=UPI00301708F2
MCGRYTITVTMEELMLRYYIGEETGPYHRPRYNIAPGQSVPAIVGHEGRNRLGELRWGLVPHWAKEERLGTTLLNARAETLTEKPAYRRSFERRRCLIPADGFYEWKKAGSGKQPMRIVMKDNRLFSMAGLYDIWIAPDGKRLATCAIVTTTPNPLMAGIHDRMPVVLRQEDEPLWLDRSVQDTARLQKLLVPYPGGEMRAYPVAAAVGNVRNDGPECIRELSEEEQGGAKGETVRQAALELPELDLEWS